MKQEKAPWYFLLLLILAGESIFILPFVIARVFRPTVLNVLKLDNVQLGLCFSFYGLIALASYGIGGLWADKYPPRKSISVALWMTALGGLFYASFPNYSSLKLLYGYWGFTTIFLFWSPMIKATRIWGGTVSQGKAFAFLDGGRGLVASLFGAMGVLVFSLFINSHMVEASSLENSLGLKYVILYSSGLVFLVGLLIWFFLKLEDSVNDISLEKIRLSQIKQVIRLPAVWLLMMIVLCAYVGYKITDVFSLYAQDVMGYDQLNSAKVGTILLFVRPVLGLIIGLLADRTKITLWLFVSFVLTFLGALLFASGIISSSSTFYFFLTTLVVATGVYTARSLYFAVMEKGKIPLTLTGTAVGLISLIGFTPDIFAGPLMGYFLDRNPGPIGHQHVFIILALFSFIGAISSWLYYQKFQK